MPSRVLVVEDDATVASIVASYLAQAGFAADVVGDGTSALTRAVRDRPDLVVLDLTLPGMDGMEVLRHLRRDSGPPVIVLTARVAEAERIRGLRAGADDYVTKPFHPLELVERVRAVLRRAAPVPLGDQRFTIGSVSLDERVRRVSVQGREVSLTALEFDLLAFLMHHPGEVFRREVLLQRVWGFTYGDTATVTVHIARLRGRIEADPAAPKLIRTVWGVGYSFDPVDRLPG